MSWGTRRRNTVIFIVIAILIIPVLIGAFLYFYEPPNCFDGQMNGDEQGVDCGGSCELLCNDKTLNPIVLWERFFEVSDGVYNAIAYIENQNPSAKVELANYRFQLFNREDVLIAEREGVVKIPPKSVVPVTELNIQTFAQNPNRISFEFTNNLIFEKEEPKSPSLIIKDEEFLIDNSPRVNAKVQNVTLKRVEDVEVIVLLYDRFDNVVAISSTYLEEVAPEVTRNIVFTWPRVFEEEITRIEIIPIYE